MCIPRKIKLVSSSKTFHKALQKGDTKTVAELLDKQPWLIHDQSTRSPLWEAVSFGHLDIVKLLVKLGVDVRQEGHRGGETLLTWLAKSSIEHVRMFEFLINHGADVNEQCPLRHAIRRGKVKCAKLLLEHGAKVNQLNSNQLLFEATASSCPGELIKLLVEYRVDVSKQKFGKNILHYLSSEIAVDLEVVELLISRGAALDEFDCFGFAPLHYAVRNNRESLIILFIKHRANVNKVSKITEESPLWLAAEVGNESTIDLLIDEGAEVNGRCKQGRTPLHRACECLRQSCVRKLLERGAQIGILDETGRSPFAILDATNDKHLPIIKLLIREFAKMELEGLSVDPGDMKMMCEQSTLQCYHQECLEELGALKTIRFYGCYTIYEVIKRWRDKRRLAKLMRNEEFFGGLESSEFMTTVCHYAADLFLVLNDALTLSWTMTAMEAELDKIIGDALPAVPKRIILQYMKPRDFSSI